MSEAQAITIEQERERLLSFKKAELVVIAQEMSVPISGNKDDLADRIIAKKMGQPVEPVLEPPDQAKDTAGTPPGEPSGPPQPGVKGGSAESAEAEAAEAEEEAEIEPAPVLIKHLMLTAFHMPDEAQGILNDVGVKERLEEWFARGYDLIEFQPLGFSPAGHRVLWVFKKVDKPKYRQALFILRLLTPMPNPQRGTISGQMADGYISAFIEQGWDLIGAKANGLDVVGETTTGVFMIWMLAK